MPYFLTTIHASWKHGFTGYDESREIGTYLVEATDMEKAKTKAERWTKENIKLSISEPYEVHAKVHETIK